MINDRLGGENKSPRTALSGNVSPVLVMKRHRSLKVSSVGESSGASILLKANIGGAEQRAVVEKGSGLNLMSREIIEQYSVPLQMYEGTLYHAGKKQIRLLAKKNLPDCLEGKMLFDLEFLVAPMLANDVILGTGF